MFNSIEESLNIIHTLGKKGLVESKEYWSAVTYLKGKGYIVSGIGLREDEKVWNYRALRSEIYSLKSLNNSNCNKCLDGELFKNWKISTMNIKALQKIKERERTENYLF